MAQTLLIKKNGIDRLVNPVFFDYGDVVFEPSRLRVVGPGVDAAEFVDAGIAQLSQRRGCSLAAVSTAAVDQDRGVLLRNHLGGSILVNRAYRQQDSAGDVTAVVFVLLPHIQDNDLLGVHHFFGRFLVDLLVGGIGGISTTSRQQQNSRKCWNRQSR